MNTCCKPLLAFIISVLAAAPGCASPGAASHEREKLQRVNELYMAGKFDDAIRVAEPLKQSSTPEIVFSVGHLYLARAQAEARSNGERASDSERFVRYVERAALLGLDDASRLLEAVFRYGSYGAVPVDLARANCWQQVANKQASARECAREEK